MAFGSTRIVLACLLLGSTPARAEPPTPPTGRALIVIGLPGDKEHAAAFRATAKKWRDWLTGPLRFAPGDVRILSGPAEGSGSGDAPGTRESIAAEVKAWREVAGGLDRAWVFVLGHANVDDDHAFLHLPGPDLRDDEFAAIFRGLPAKEQVFWLTTSAAGWFLPALSAPGRVVVAATERDKEFNETEFPHALADVAGMPQSKIDADRDGRVSVLEVYVATVAAVEKRFASDKRLATEHARLDDDGNGEGTEAIPSPPPSNGDGTLASKTLLPPPQPNP